MKKLSFILLFIFTFIFMVNGSLASAKETDSNVSTSSVKDTDSYTLGEVEQILVDYLNSKGKDFKVDSKQYFDFIIDQFNNDTDQELAKRADYRAITAYMSEYEYQLSLQTAKKQSKANVLSKTIKNLTIGELKEQISNEEAAAEKLKQYSQPSTFATTYTYSVTAAKSYAANWYNGRNPVFPLFPVDCTNFVSQILFAGGMPMNFSTTNGWYANTSDNSISWSAVPEFFTYWAQTKTTVTSLYKSDIIAEAKEGDIVQLKKDGATRWSHSMFVYEKSNSTLYLSAHTDDYLKKDFKTISTDWTSFRVIKM